MLVVRLVSAMGRKWAEHGSSLTGVRAVVTESRAVIWIRASKKASSSCVTYGDDDLTQSSTTDTNVKGDNTSDRRWMHPTGQVLL